MKKDNKGFSLVEIIVVVLIIAIISVALVPQVMKWVENSRISSDLETKESIEKMCQFALTDESIFEEVKDGGYTITIEKDSTGTRVICASSNASATPAFWDKFFAMGGYADLNEFENSIELKSTPATAPKVELIVHVYEDGHTYSTLTGCASDDIDIH